MKIKTTIPQTPPPKEKKNRTQRREENICNYIPKKRLISRIQKNTYKPYKKGNYLNLKMTKGFEYTFVQRKCANG